MSKTSRTAELVVHLEVHESGQLDKALGTGLGATEQAARAPRPKKAKTRCPNIDLEGPLPPMSLRIDTSHLLLHTNWGLGISHCLGRVSKLPKQEP